MPCLSVWCEILSQEVTRCSESAGLWHLWPEIYTGVTYLVLFHSVSRARLLILPTKGFVESRLSRSGEVQKRKTVNSTCEKGANVKGKKNVNIEMLSAIVGQQHWLMSIPEKSIWLVSLPLFLVAC